MRAENKSKDEEASGCTQGVKENGWKNLGRNKK